MLIRSLRRCWVSTHCFFMVCLLTFTVSVYFTTFYRDAAHHLDATQSEQACVLRKFELWHPALNGLFKKIEPLTCSETEENWVYTSNGSVYISPSAGEKHGKILCEYLPLKRGTDDFQVLYQDAIKPDADGMPMVSDFFEARCVGQDGMTYENIHSGIRRDPELQKNMADVNLEVQTSVHTLGLNILMVGFDSVSSMTWQRHLPKSHRYFTQTLGGIVLEGYNIVGGATLEALLPILTGQTEQELPEARPGFPHTTTLDNHPWIWKELKKLGYITQWGEDDSRHSTFTYRMLGFKQQPVDHYLRPFYMEAEKMYARWLPYCLGSTPRYLNMLNWVREFFQMYPHKPKFSLLFHSEYTHDLYNALQWADDDLRDFLEFMQTEGHLDNTVLVLMGDHGARYHPLRQTVQGKYEARMPYFSFRMPPKFQKQHPDVMQNLMTNAQRLTTPFDIHATFEDIINFTGAGVGDVKDRGISLFKEIPNERTCADAAVGPHWCTCLSWVDVNVTERLVRRAADSILVTINNFTQNNREDCAELILDKITSAVKLRPNDKNVLPSKVTEVLYQVTIITKPSLARYEATLRYLLEQDSFRTNLAEISRINRYDVQPHCIMGKLALLRPFCFCKVQLHQ